MHLIDSPHGREYTAALALIDAHAAEWMPAVEPTEAADEEAV